MNNKNLMALIAATTITTSASAGFFLTGDYEGTISDGNPGAATYAQDLDITMVGDIADGTKVTATFENLGADVDGGSTVKSTQVFIETDLEGIDFKGGNYKTQNGSGLMQKKSAVVNQMQVGFDVGGRSNIPARPTFNSRVAWPSGNRTTPIDTPPCGKYRAFIKLAGTSYSVVLSETKAFNLIAS
jgi:hypothetical protein